METLLTTGLYYATFAWATALFMIIYEYNSIAKSRRFFISLLLSSYILSFILTWLCSHSWLGVIPLAVALIIFTIVSFKLPDFSLAGKYLFSSFIVSMFLGTSWGFWFIATIPVSTLTRSLLFSGCFFFALKLPVALVQTYEVCEVVGRKKWHRPQNPLPVLERAHYPKVCFQVPAYSEPPELVCATLDALNRVDYPNFEVMVIDNNTRDPELWQPVEAYCQKLGNRFRFFHLEHCPGAKAGALNFALKQTNTDVELIAVVDSDYLVQPDFLSRLIGYFDDPKMGFVQARHAYRELHNSRYLSMCNLEYRLFFATTLVSRNERNAGITVGTMSLIRRKALEEAGGWAEWCLTEDSELAVRIHARGYLSVYLNNAFGRGLIPETFSAYKKQRFRWTFGPVQELKRHFRLFLPRPFARPSSLTTAQKLHHLTHGMENLEPGLGLLSLPLFLAILVSMIVQQETIDLPVVVWLVSVVTLILNPIFSFFLYRSQMGCSFIETLGALVASWSLSYTKAIASFSAIIKKTTSWKRTNKFKLLPSKFRILSSIQLEIIASILLFAISGVSFVMLPQSDFAYLLIIGMFLQNSSVIAAIIMAFLSETELFEKHKQRIISEQLEACVKEILSNQVRWPQLDLGAT